MNLNKLNTAKACNEPQRCALRDPFTGELLESEDGKSVEFYVLGVHSDRVRNALKDRDRRYGDKSKMSDDEAAQAGAEFLAAAVTGWSSNVEDDDGPIEYSQERAARLFREQDWIAAQVRDFCFNLRNFDPKRSRAFDTGRARSHGSTAAPRKKSGAVAKQRAGE